MSQKPSLFYLTTELPYPANSGGRLKTYRLLKELTTEFEVRLLCAHGGDRPHHMRSLKDEVGLESIQAFQKHEPRTPLNWFKAVMTSPSFNSWRIYSKELETMVKWSVESADLTIIDHLEVVDLIPENFRGKIVYHSHNCEFKLWKDFKKTVSNPLMKWALDWETERVKVLERYAINRCKFTFAAPNDQALLVKELGVKEEKFKNTYHLGNDELLELPILNTANSKPQFFYAGTLSWEPNKVGLKWFLKESWPIIQKQNPEASFVVCGSGADDELISLMNGSSGVTYQGFVKDLNELINESAAAIIPLRFGSGMKIKTFDALYRGIPLACTDVAAEGIDIQHQKHALIANNAKDLAHSALQLLSNRESAMTMAANGREMVKSKYTYKALGKQMIADLKSLLQ